MPAVGPRWGVNRLNSSMAYGLENAELRKGRYTRKLGASYTELKAVASKFQPPARQSNSETSGDRGNVQWHRMPSSIAPDVQVPSVLAVLCCTTIAAVEGKRYNAPREGYQKPVM